MITTQGDREMHSNISINLSKKSNSKRSYPTETRTYNSRNTSSQSLYAQAVNGQLKNPTSTRRATHSTTTASSNWTTHTRTASSTTNTRTTNSRTNYTQWADKTLSSANFLKHRNQAPTQSIADLKKLVKKDEVPVRVFGLWGLEEIWINMTVIEYKDDIIILASDGLYKYLSENEIKSIVTNFSDLNDAVEALDAKVRRGSRKIKLQRDNMTMIIIKTKRSVWYDTN